MNNSDQMRGIMEAFYNAAPYGMPGEQDDSSRRKSLLTVKLKSKAMLL